MLHVLQGIQGAIWVKAIGTSCEIAHKLEGKMFNWSMFVFNNAIGLDSIISIKGSLNSEPLISTNWIFDPSILSVSGEEIIANSLEAALGSICKAGGFNSPLVGNACKAAQ